MASEDQKKVIAAMCWKKGNEALGKENWDYAIEQYFTSVKMAPDNLVYRQSLRGAEQRKYNNNGKGAAMAGMKLMGVNTSIKTARLKKNWADLAAAAEEGLKINPWDAGLNAALGDACKELGYNDVAIFAYEMSLKSDGTNKQVLVSLADVHESRGNFEQAAGCWERVVKLDPLYQGARSKITSLTTEKAMEKARYDQVVDDKGKVVEHIARDIMRTQSGGGKGDSADGPGMSLEADLQRAIRKEPNNRDNYLKLGDYYKREGELEKAREQYEKAYEVSGQNQDIKEKVEDVELDLMRNALDLAKQEAAQDPEKRKQVGALAVELLEKEIEVFKARIERYPNDLQKKFELGLRYMRKQMWTDAIPLFQVSSGDPRVKAEALVNLGKCFIYDKKLPLAKRQFEKAVPEVKFEEKPDLFKDLHYSFGRLLDDLGDKPGAEEHYQTVIEVDYNYKDANDRLTKLQS